MGHSHPVHDRDAHFTIDTTTRAIKNDSLTKTVLVQHDHNSERFTFVCPRRIEEHDLSECNKVEVHYLNVGNNGAKKQQNSGLYVVTDLRVNPEDEETVICTWLVSNNATKLAGKLTFLLRFCCVENGVTMYAWNTLEGSVNVSTGLDSAGMFESEYLDVIEQWKESVMRHFANDLADWKTVTGKEVREEAFADILVERQRIDLLSNYVTPQMFGAKADGMADDTQAIQRAIDASDYVFIPSGVYLISKSLVVEKSTGYYGGNGYRGKHILGTPSTKVVINTNNDVLIVRGFHNTIENLILTFQPALWGVYNHTLCLVESLSANAVKASCNNLFKNIRCVSTENIWEHSGKFCGTGFKLVSDASNATYQNRYENCVAADLYEGLVVESGSTVGINANYYHIDLWNCNYLFKGNPSGSYFAGCNQAPAKLSDEENVCFDVYGFDNVFDSFTYDVGAFGSTETPFLDLHNSRNNRFSQFVDLSAVRGSVKSNCIQSTNLSAYHVKKAYSLNNGIGSIGEGVQSYSIAPWDNGLRNDNYAKSITLTTEGVTVFDAASSTLYPSKNTNGIPKEVSALAGKSMAKKMSFTCQEDAKFVFRFALAEYTIMDSLHLYFTHQRLAPKTCVVRNYQGGFGSTVVKKREFDFSMATAPYLTCLNLTVPYEPIKNDSFVELELTFPAGVVGFAYLCAPMHNHFDGPVCEP